MPDENLSPGEANPAVQPFAEFWNDYLDHSNESAKQFFESFDGKGDLEAWRQKWLEAMGQSMEAFLRSPAFLQAVKHNTDVVVRLKKEWDQAGKEVARNAGIPTAGDISGLFERLHTIEHGILERLNQIETRIAAIEQKFGEGNAGKA